MENLTKKIAGVKIIQTLYRKGLLNDNSFSAAMQVLRPYRVWFSWVTRHLLFIGAALMLAGVIFFFAYNWAKMEKFLKFALLQFSIIACIAATYFCRVNNLTRKILILAASIFIGVLLAVYGQIYQTGADAFELFFGWSFLILLWVIVSEFTALWCLWLILINTGLILFWEQVGRFAYSIKYEWLCLTLSLINALALILVDRGSVKGIKWLSGSKWMQIILFITVLVDLSVPAIRLIVDFDNHYHAPNKVTALAFFIWILVSFAGYYYYKYKRKEMLLIAIIAMNCSVILLTFIGKILFQKNHNKEGMFLLFALIIIGVVSATIFWLKKESAAMITSKAGENNG
jgi:uncharacterized membrane protein